MESEWIDAGEPLLICGVDYEVPPDVIERRRAQMAGRRIIEEVDAEGVSHFRCEPPIEQPEDAC